MQEMTIKVLVVYWIILTKKSFQISLVENAW